jgi:chemotaxis protein MotB
VQAPDLLGKEQNIMFVGPKSITTPKFGMDADNTEFLAAAGTSKSNSQLLSRHRWDFIEHHTIDLPAHWSVPWSDLMMIMMVMFAVMYAAKLPEGDASVSLKKGAPITSALPPQQEKPQIEKSETTPISSEEIFRLSEKLVREANLANIDVVLTDNDAIKVSVHGNLFFDLGLAELKPEAVSFLDQLAGIIAANNYNIEVSGHTDDFPISSPVYPTNWELSTARASRVARYLIEQGKLEPGRFTVMGHASYQPTLPNTTLTNKAQNRRVEIVITRKEYKS